MSTEVYAGRECSVALISPIDGSTLLTVPYVRTLSVQDKIVYARRTAHKSAAISAPVIRANGSVILTKDAESMAVVNEIKRWANGVYSYSLASNLKGKRYRHPHLRMTMTNSDGTVETITAYDVKPSDRSLSRSDATLSDSITLDALGGIDTPNNDHGDPFKALTLFRTGSATYINTAGTLTTAGDGVARFTSKGLQLEGAGTNLLPNSGFEAGSLTAWSSDSYGAATAGTAAVATNQTFGSAYSAKLTSASGQNIRILQPMGSVVTAQNTNYTISGRAYIESLTSGQPMVRFACGVAAPVINLDTSKIGSWQYFTATCNSGGSTGGELTLATAPYQGTAVCVVYFDDVQIEASPFATSYIENISTSGSASRSPDLCALTVPHNYYQYSQDFTQAVWAKDTGASISGTTTAPDGTNTAQVITFASGGAVRQVSNLKVSGLAACNSVWMRVPSGSATVHLVLTDYTSTNLATQSCTVTTNWQRFAVYGTFPTSATGTLTIQIDTGGASLTLHAWAAQGEQASIPGIYVPTTSQALPKPTDGTEWPAWMTQNGFVEFDVLPPPISTGKGYNILGATNDVRFQLVRNSAWGTNYSGLFWDRSHNSVTGTFGNAGRGYLEFASSIFDGAKHRVRLVWMNYTLGGICYMLQQLWVDGVLVASQDVAALYGATAWIAPERLWLSDGNTFATLSNLSFGIAPLPNGATPAA